MLDLSSSAGRSRVYAFKEGLDRRSHVVFVCRVEHATEKDKPCEIKPPYASRMAAGLKVRETLHSLDISRIIVISAALFALGYIVSSPIGY